jgi:ketosteroid isomerase-like protein
MRRILFLALLSATTVSILGMSAVVSAEESVGRVPTVTRLVSLFYQLEEELSGAVNNRNMTAVSKLLSDDFEMRVGAMPGNPIPRATWIKRSFNEPKSSSLREQMAVHDFGKIAIVSFLWKIRAAKSKMVREVFVVDTWRREAGDWKLAVRYAGPAAQGDYPIPGVPIAKPVFEKKE